MHPEHTPRRRHDAELKAKVLAACDEPGASVAGVARSHDLNANLVHMWRRGRGVPPALRPAKTAVSEFVALALAMPATAVAQAPSAMTTAATAIRIDLQRGATRVGVSGPATAAAECAGWLRELLR